MAYIKKYAYKNASTEDLWLSLSEQSGEPVRELMDSWTKQKGYPVLAVTIKGSELEVKQVRRLSFQVIFELILLDGKSIMLFLQSQYLSSGLSGSGEWVVPVTICIGSYSSVTRYLVRGKVCSVPLPPSFNEDGGSHLKEMSDGKRSSNWIKLNVGQTSFYRVQYDEGLAARLRAAIASGSLEATDRFGKNTASYGETSSICTSNHTLSSLTAGILDDTYALCSACKQPLATLLSLMDAFREETDYTVLGSLISVSKVISLFDLWVFVNLRMKPYFCGDSGSLQDTTSH